MIVEDIKKEGEKAHDWGEIDLAELIVAAILLWSIKDSSKGENTP